jgi:hypothetical protein
MNLVRRVLGIRKRRDRAPEVLTTADWPQHYEESGVWVDEDRERETVSANRFDSPLETLRDRSTTPAQLSPVEFRKTAPAPGRSFLLGLQDLKGLEYLSAQELLSYIAWGDVSRSAETTAFSLGELASEMQWEDEPTAPQLSKMALPIQEKVPLSYARPSCVLGLQTIPNLELLSASELLQMVAWEENVLAGQVASEEDLGLLGDLLVGFPED